MNAEQLRVRVMRRQRAAVVCRACGWKGERKLTAAAGYGPCPKCRGKVTAR